MEGGRPGGEWCAVVVKETESESRQWGGGGKQGAERGYGVTRHPNQKLRDGNNGGEGKEDK